MKLNNQQPQQIFSVMLMQLHCSKSMRNWLKWALNIQRPYTIRHKLQISVQLACKLMQRNLMMTKMLKFALDLHRSQHLLLPQQHSKQLLPRARKLCKKTRSYTEKAQSKQKHQLSLKLFPPILVLLRVSRCPRMHNPP